MSRPRARTPRRPSTLISIGCLGALLGLIAVITLVVTHHRAATGPASLLRAAGPPNGPTDSLAAYKASVMTAEASARSQAASTAPANDELPPPPTVAAATPSAGIVAADQSPLPSSEFAVTNTYKGPSSDPATWLTVYAGQSFVGGAPAPAVMIYATPSDPNAPNPYLDQVGIFDAPSSVAGQSLTITNVTGSTIQLDVVPAGGTSSPSNSSAQHAGPAAAAGTQAGTAAVDFNFDTDQYTS